MIDLSQKESMIDLSQMDLSQKSRIGLAKNNKARIILSQKKSKIELAFDLSLKNSRIDLAQKSRIGLNKNKNQGYG